MQSKILKLETLKIYNKLKFRSKAKKNDKVDNIDFNFHHNPNYVININKKLDLRYYICNPIYVNINIILINWSLEHNSKNIFYFFKI